MRNFKELKETDNPTVLWKVRRKYVLNCDFCPPHKLENFRKRPRPDKYKNISRESIRRYLLNKELEGEEDF